MSESEPVFRDTVKAVLTDDTGRYLTLRTNLGIFNIPGGGLNAGEDQLTALKREITEELPGFELYDLSDMPIGCVDGAIIRNRWARWHVYTGRVAIPENAVPGVNGQIPQENHCFELLSIQQVYKAESTGSRLATRAILLAREVAARKINEPQLLISPRDTFAAKPTG